MDLYIHGLGTCAVGSDSDFADATAKLENVPIKEYATASLRRRYGNVAKMMYIAACRALTDANIEDTGQVAIIAATAAGEVTTGLKLLEQIHNTRGVRISPALVPNAVHNAPAGHMSIGFKSRAPSITVSQGSLTAEAALMTASDLLEFDNVDVALVVVGDEADPVWEQRLKESGASRLSQKLADKSFQEGAAAMIIGKVPGAKHLGRITASVERANEPKIRINEIIREYLSLKDILIVARTGAGGEEISDLHSEVQLDGPGLGTSQIGAWSRLISEIKGSSQDKLLLIAKEIEDIGFLFWQRQS